jgi:hypothetical protein
VGATADITSKGSLNLVNSGLGKALVRVSVFSENGALTPRDLVVDANSFKQISLPSLAPGAKSIAIHIEPKSGRVNGFLVDERSKGLRLLGGDIVNSTDDPGKKLQIPAIPQQVKKKTPTPHILRLLVPGDVDARISAEIRSTDGTFSPVGINGKVIAHKKVIEIPMNILMHYISHLINRFLDPSFHRRYRKVRVISYGALQFRTCKSSPWLPPA